MIATNLSLFDLKTLGPLKNGIFKQRLNRFISRVDVNGKELSCHVADTGRLTEILTPGREITVAMNRRELKTDCRLVACKMDNWTLINTSIHSRIAYNAIKLGLLGYLPEMIKNEVNVGKSRLDFLINNSIYIELKGCNLLENGLCRFPDAPTSRGKRHVEELIALKKKGFQAIIMIMAMRECSEFRPADHKDPDFAETFYTALEAGVEFLGFKVNINPDTWTVHFNGTLELAE